MTNPMIKVFGASWQTSIIGILAGVAVYIHEMGPNLPHDASGWTAALLGGLLSSLGMASKGTHVTNSPNPTTPQILTGGPPPQPPIDPGSPR